MLIAITGISGFLGSHLFKSLSTKHDIIGISTSHHHQMNERLYAFSNLEKISKIPEVVIHCHAAISSGLNNVDKKTLLEANVIATEKIVNAFPKSKHIYISTVSVYEQSDEIKTECSNVYPVSDYAASKSQGEKIVLNSDNAVIVRLSSLYGIGMKENTIIPNYVKQALVNKNIEVWGAGSRMQNYIHVSDVVNLIEHIIHKDHWSKKIYLGVSDKEYSNLELAEMISRYTNAGIQFVNTDLSVSNRFDNRFTRNELNWIPKADISLELKKIIEWKREQS
jgi:UDP-glucose 4-epimerase